MVLVGKTTMTYKHICIIFFLLFIIGAHNSHASQSPENVGDFFKSIEQGGTNNTPDAGEGVQSLPGVEITPEQMQDAFPTPLSQDSQHMDFIPNAAPLFPALPMQEAGTNSQQNHIKSPQVLAPPPVPSPQLSKPNQATPNDAKTQVKTIIPENTAKPSQTFSFDTQPQKDVIQDIQQAKISLQNPSLEMMVGQMILAGFNGGELEKEAEILKLINQGKVGGIFLISSPKPADQSQVKLEQASSQEAYSVKQENIYSPSQVRVLTATLQSAVPKGGLPLFIATEQEGGTVQSLRTDLGFSGLKAAASLGQGNIEATEIAARSAGLEMAGLGINFTLGPAGDVNLNPLSEDIGKRFRSFGPNPQLVAEHVLAFGKGLEAANVLPCLRNFPGTGSRMGGFLTQSSIGDTQNILYEIPDISASWQSRELIPYTKAIESGWKGAIQPALAYHRSLDALHPAPLSRTLLHGILRGRMGFDGIIISQDMRALQPRYSLEASVIQAIIAGVDIILITEPAHLQSQPQNILEQLPLEELLGQGNDLTKQLLKQGLGKAMPGMGFGANLEQKIQTGYANEAAKVYEIIINAVRSGRIPMENIRASWQRILKAKRTFLNIDE